MPHRTTAPDGGDLPLRAGAADGDGAVCPPRASVRRRCRRRAGHLVRDHRAERARPARTRGRRRAGDDCRAGLRRHPRGRTRRRRPSGPSYAGRTGGRRPRRGGAGRASRTGPRAGNGSLNRPLPLPKRAARPYGQYMLEPRGAASMFESATDDDSAHVVNQARDALFQGRIADAMDAVDRARRRGELDEPGRVVIALVGLLGRLALGDLRGAASYSRDLTGLLRTRGALAATANFGLGEFAAARGQDDQAISYYQRAGDEMSASGEHTWIPWRSGLARIIASRSQVAAANQLVEQELVDARHLELPYAVAYALRTQAAIAPTELRVRLLDEALDVLAGTDAARLDAQIRPALAGWLLPLQPGQSGRAVDLLRASEKYARQEGLAPLLSRVRWLLERLGESPEGELPGRLAELSAAERRVALLVVTGKRNREIAEELGVSVKSVEWHVSHILRKLSIRSRQELTVALAQPRQAR